MSEIDIRLASLEHYQRPYRSADESIRESLMPVTEAISILTAYKAEYNPGELIGEVDEVLIAGRVVLKRNAGRIVFATLRSLDRDAQLLQAFLAPQNMGEESISFFKQGVHLGDILYVRGRLGYSNTHELTLHVTSWEMATKSLNPTPKVIKNPQTGQLDHDLNKESIHESPVLHMLTSSEHRQNIIMRSAMIQQIRSYLGSSLYLEVETPMLSTRAGGAAAAKFSTVSNYRHQNLYLRIATELYLKRLVIGGMGNVFEIGKNFRNEGIDRTHSPEFTALEAYTLHSDYLDQMRLVKEIINAAWMNFGNNPMDAYSTVSFYTALSQGLVRRGLPSVSPQSTQEEVMSIYQALNLEPAQGASKDRLTEDLFDEVALPDLHGTVFVMDYPTGTTPLAMANGDGTSQKWDLYIEGMEIATAYTENTDPIVQEANLPDDEDFVNDLRYGMPPLGGLGIGLDRLAMVLTGAGHINSVSAFPHSSV